MFLVSIAVIAVVMGLVQFSELGILFCIYIDIVIDGIVNKLQYSVSYIKKKDMNRVPLYTKPQF